jgi:hypothetical protein
MDTAKNQGKSFLQAAPAKAKMLKVNGFDKILWSIALPGFGQLLNGQFLKGLLFLVLEFILNCRARLNDIIILSFNGETYAAAEHTDYHWLMFYPCVYMFAMYDAYRDGGGDRHPLAVLPFVLAAFLATVGMIYSKVWRIRSVFLGPVWAPMILCFVGVFLGLVLKRVLLKREQRRSIE